MENEILEVEIELGGGEKLSMNIQESYEWSTIEKDTRALLSLINGQQMLVYISEACEDSGVSFKIKSDDMSYHYEASVVSQIYVEVK